MSEQEKAKRIEEHLPAVEVIIDEYRTQGRELTRAAAEQIRERLRADLTAGHVDAMENVLGDNALDAVAGGGCIGGAPTPTATPHGSNDGGPIYSPIDIGARPL